MKITQQRDGREVLDYEFYTQHLLTVLSNRITAFASGQYLKQFGLGSVEMRVLASIGCQPECKAAEISSLISLDKAAVSRAINKLDSAGFLLASTETPTAKQKRWSLSSEGWSLHDQFLNAVKLRHAKVIAGVDAAELASFTATLHKLIANVDQLQDK